MPYTVFAQVEWNTGIENAWSNVAEFVPNFLLFLVILGAGFIVAKAISKAIDRVLDRTGFDRAVQRGGIAKAMSKSQYDAGDLVSKVIFYTLFLFVLQFAFGVFGPNPVSNLIASVVSYLPLLIVASIIVVVASAIAAAVREVIQASLGGLSYGKTLANAAAVVILGIGGFAALNQLQIAEPIVNGLFYAILATTAGIAIIAVGGGGVRPMQNRWERTLSRYDEEKPRMASEMQDARRRIDLRAEELRSKAERQPETSGAGRSGSSQGPTFPRQ